MRTQLSVHDVSARGLMLFKAISGSRAYGTNKPTSDTDYRGIYLAPFDDVMGVWGEQDQVADDTNDTVYYELKRFIQLIEKQNPNILEMLYLPEDCLLYRHPFLDELFEKRDQFLTKTCLHSFAGYAVAQIKKAKGLNKKINDPAPAVRQTVLDFCYFMVDGKTIPAKEYLSRMGEDSAYDEAQRYCGLVALEHMRFTYAVYYDYPSYKSYQMSTFKGIVQDEETSNDVCLSSVPKEAHLLGYMQFNKDAYQVACKKYKETKEWEEKRNPERYQVTIENGNDYDAKNMMHCIRLIRVAQEIATQKIINVRRPDREELMYIRNGLASYDDLLVEAETTLASLDELYANSNLPDKVDSKVLNNILVNLRKKLYML